MILNTFISPLAACGTSFNAALQRDCLELTDFKLQLASCLGFSRWQYFVTLVVSIGADSLGRR